MIWYLSYLRVDLECLPWKCTLAKERKKNKSEFHLGGYLSRHACTLSLVRFCDPKNCNPLGSSVHGIFQARILLWVAISSFRGSSQPWDPKCISCTGRQIVYHSHLASSLCQGTFPNIKVTSKYTVDPPPSIQTCDRYLGSYGEKIRTLLPKCVFCTHIATVSSGACWRWSDKARVWKDWIFCVLRSTRLSVPSKYETSFSLVSRPPVKNTAAWLFKTQLDQLSIFSIGSTTCKFYDFFFLSCLSKFPYL